MKIIVWNCKGAASKGFGVVFPNLCNEHGPEMVLLLEPWISGRSAKNTMRRLGFKCTIVEEARGFAGGYMGYEEGGGGEGGRGYKA